MLVELLIPLTFHPGIHLCYCSFPGETWGTMRKASSAVSCVLVMELPWGPTAPGMGRPQPRLLLPARSRMSLCVTQRRNCTSEIRHGATTTTRKPQKCFLLLEKFPFHVIHLSGQEVQEAFSLWSAVSPRLGSQGLPPSSSWFLAGLGACVELSSSVV